MKKTTTFISFFSGFLFRNPYTLYCHQEVRIARMRGNDPETYDYHLQSHNWITMNITTVKFEKQKSKVKKFILEESIKMKQSCVGWNIDGVYNRIRGYKPIAQKNLARYNNGGTSQYDAYVEIVLQSDIKKIGRRNIEDDQVIRITNSEAWLPSVIEYCKRSGFLNALGIKKVND